MSITNDNPFLINIQPIQNSPADLTGSTQFGRLRADVNNLQQIIFGETRSAQVSIGGRRVVTNIPVPNCNIGGDGSGGGSEYMGSNSYNWEFKPSTIGGTDIRDATGIPRSSADTYTNAITKLDYWLYENLVDQPPAPSYTNISNTISSINYYWANPKQFKLGILNVHAPYISTLKFKLYSNAIPATAGLFATFEVGTPYIPHSGTPVQGVEFMNNFPNGTINVYSNAIYKSYILQVGVASDKLNTSLGPYRCDVFFNNYSENSNKILNYSSNSIANLVTRAPTTNDFRIDIYNNNTIGVYIIATTTATYLTPAPVYYYSVDSGYGLNPVNVIGPFNSGAQLTVTQDGCGYTSGSIFNFKVKAINTEGESGIKSQPASTGLAPVASTPGVSVEGSFNYTNGAPTITYSTTNQDGTINWYFTSGVATTGTGIVSSSFTLTPSGYFQYFNTNFTLAAYNSAFCKRNSPVATATYNQPYTIAAPIITVSVEQKDNPPYAITATATNLPSVPAGLTLTTSWTTITGTVTNISDTNSSKSCTGTLGPVFRFGAIYTLTDSAGRTRVSAQGTGFGTSALIVHDFTGTILPTQSLSFTYPNDAVESYASASTGYTYTGTPGAGRTITFQRISPAITISGTYSWGYKNNTP